MYCQGQEALGLSESERTSSEEPRAAVSVCQTMGVLDTAYRILYDFLCFLHPIDTELVHNALFWHTVSYLSCWYWVCDLYRDDPVYRLNFHMD